MNSAPTQDDIREALRVCFDPELSVNIVDLGLVYSVDIQQDTEWPGFQPRYVPHVVMTMRAPSEEREAMLIGQVKNRLAGLPDVSRSEVTLVWEPAWTADRMSAAARQQLGLDRAPRQGLVTIKL
ncbi:metal-sulfur cluster assembly factor [Terriglobus roseus]|uniref:Metal-sulfur cluster biosynthetic enzyme n=1 Tax=Terriglobus roseus TaxID=392734 RepID=A0A1H4R5E7_9BACT|nr:metal-sulfur cluster assembly factor [Terriglobus roseus]SEC27103.1 Metal-sulfur cluster biosynthetic enzyme [Terriglobus roseus]